MMGYAQKSKGYELWDIELKKKIISKDVKFCKIQPETVSTAPSDRNSEIDDRGRDVEKIDLHIKNEDDSHSDMTEENTENNSACSSNPESDQFEEWVPQKKNQNKDPAENEAPKRRRSPREFTKPKEWWKSSRKGLVARVVPLSYKSATTPKKH